MADRILRRFSDPGDFLARAGSLLRAAEAENVLMLGVCEAHQFDGACYLATVEEDDAVVACAVRTPPHSALLARAGREALELLVEDLAARCPDLPAVAGPEPTVGLFAELWCSRTGASVRPATRMRVFEAREVVRPPLPPGTFRAATEADLSIVSCWASAFFDEVGLRDPGGAAREQIGEGRLFIWEDGRPVSMAAWAGRTGTTVRINSVYTPPGQRGRGYASACVAGLTQRLLDEGLASCCLYTDLANPTSNKIYQAIGYRPVCDAAEYGLQAGEEGGGPVTEPPAVELAPFVRDRDAPLLETWLHRPHVSRWWGDPREVAAEVTELPAGGGEALILAGGAPVGYVRWQVPAREELDAAGLHEVPSDAVDIDIAIGEADLLDRGVGSRALTILRGRLLQDGATTIVLATSVDNARAVRACEKAGFARRRRFVDTDGETYWLMVAK